MSDQSVEELLEELARLGTNVPAEPGGELGKLLRENGGICGASVSYIEVQVEDGTRLFQPDGGLTVDHFRLFSPALEYDPDKADLALAVLRNALIRRGHIDGPYRQATQKLACELDLAQAIAGGDFDMVVHRAQAILLEIQAAQALARQPTEEVAAEARRALIMKRKDLAAGAKLMRSEQANPFGDWSFVKTLQGDFLLKPAAAKCFSVMVDLEERGLPLYRPHILKEAGISTDRRLDHVFRDSGAWGGLVRSAGKKSRSLTIYWGDGKTDDPGAGKEDD